MNNSKFRGTALALGISLLFPVGLALRLAGRSPGDLKPGPIEPATVASAEQLGNAFAMVAAHIRPCVVSVYSEKVVKFDQPEFAFPFGNDLFRQFFGDQQPQFRQRDFREKQRGMGSGMILDKQGHILTNFHVVRDTDELKVELADKRTFEAKVVGTDPRTDVAIIEMQGHLPDDLPTITLGDSDALHVGNLVLAIGAPFGLEQTVTQGIISATGRSDVGIADYEDFLQTDAPINPGNSGGPLVNMRGEVIGMNSAIATSVGQFSGVGFSIPSNLIKAMLPRLLNGEQIVRGQLGVEIQNLTKDLARQFKVTEATGALVSQVEKGSPADKAGIKVGDVILRYRDQEVEDVRHLRNFVAGTDPGTKVTIAISRDGRPETIAATIGKQSEEAMVASTSAGATMLSKLGISVQTLTPDLAKQLGVQGEKGVVITDVAEGSVASIAGLQKADVIIGADRQPVASPDELERILSKAQASVLFLVKRQGTSLFVVLQMN